MAAENSPVILTALGVTGTLGTAYLAAKGAFKSTLILDETAQNKRQSLYKERPELRDKSLRGMTPEEREIYDEAQELTFQEMWNATWKCYVPAAGVAALTVASIICATRIGTRRAAAMASAYAVAEKGFEEYRKKVAERIGKNKEREVQDEIAKDRVVKKPIPNSLVIVEGSDVLCYDMWTDRLFRSSWTALEKAANNLNFQILHHEYATLTDWYHLIGLPSTEFSDHVGWSDKMELNITTTTSSDNRPCLAVGFVNRPSAEYANRT
jgi:hypothetical protein